jgi:hypothetical protein
MDWRALHKSYRTFRQSFYESTAIEQDLLTRLFNLTLAYHQQTRLVKYLSG